MTDFDWGRSESEELVVLVVVEEEDVELAVLALAACAFLIAIISFFAIADCKLI